MVEIVADDILRRLSKGRITLPALKEAILDYKTLERKLDDILGQIDNPVVKKELAKNLQYKFENGQSFTLEEWNQWREEGWRKVFEELKKRKD